MNRTSQSVGWSSRYLASVGAIFVGLSFLVFILGLIQVHRDLELHTVYAVSGSHPVSKIVAPLLLLVASVCLLGNRLWSLVFSVLASGRVLYLSGYSRWRAVAHNIFDVPMFGWLAFEKLFDGYREQPELLAQLVLAGLIFAYALVLLVGRLRAVVFRRSITKPGS